MNCRRADHLVCIGALLALSFLLVGNMPASAASNALQEYIENPDPAYSWVNYDRGEAEGLDIYYLQLHSQTWMGIPWCHQLTILMPKERAQSDCALLFINGGSNENGQPKWKKADKETLQFFGRMAVGCGCPAAILSQVPNQPLFDGKKEDEIISFTFDKFLKTKDPNWPLLFPMVKSAVKAMDAVQAFCGDKLQWKVKKFVVSGASKRGWTTWLTGAADKRVKGIAPMVIDTLNMGPQMKHQVESFGSYSQQIEDYTKLNLPDKLGSPEGKVLTDLVDPYVYRRKLNIPKLIFMGTNDEYWPVDAIKYYFDDLQGEKYIHYVPNAGHDLGGGEQAVRALGAFFYQCARGEKHPKVTWRLSQKEDEAVLKVAADESVISANLWTVLSSDRDFRNDKWSSLPCGEENSPKFAAEVSFPKSGYKAFYVECVFPSPLGETYSQCTRVYVANPLGVMD
ncbi:MAG: PhoPQ-activated protein PqaA family protein [Candidatus Omnitrophota bacterium]